MRTSPRDQPEEVQRALVFGIPELARALGISRFAMRRRLLEENVPMRRRGAGQKRVGRFVTYADLVTHAPWVLDNIESWEALLSKGRSQ